MNQKNNKKNQFLVLIIISTVLLGVMAVITALKLYQIGKKPVAPTAPESKPEAVSSACRLSFIITVSSPTPVPTGKITATPTPTNIPTGAPTSTPTLKPTSTATAAPTITNTPAPTSTPGGPTNTPVLTVTPGGPTSTSAPTNTPRPTAQPTQPVTGLKIPTSFGILGGLLLFSLGLALIF